MEEVKFKKNDRLEVEWLDVVEDSSWLTEEEANKVDTETYCKTMGYFFKQDDNFLFISSSISSRKRKGNRSRTTIPKGMITKIRKLAIQRK